jgi:hypothetical protein
MSANASQTDCCEHLPSALSMSFNGPMFFDFATGRANGLVDVYVPYCPLHLGGFFFSTGSYSETDLYAHAKAGPDPAKWPPRNYTISSAGIKASSDLPTAIPCNGAGKLLTRTPRPKPKVPLEEQAESAELRPDALDSVYLLSVEPITQSAAAVDGPTLPELKRLFKLTVPMPRFVSALYSDILEVVPTAGEPPCGEKFAHCTSIRFYYAWDGSEVCLQCPDGYSPRPITPPLFPQLPQLADIEVRYNGIGLEDENDPHSDARACFASLATLAGADWWIYYSDGLGCPTNPYRRESKNPGKFEKPKTVFIKTGSDCHAPLITSGLSLT